MLIRTKITGIGDPFIMREGNTYFAYATSAPDGFRYFTSGNLVDWEEGGYCYKNSPWGENCFWAPEVYAYRGKYYMIYTARWKKNHSLRIGLAVAESPRGPFTDVIPGPLFDPGFASIDATLFFDDDDRIYLYFARDCSENIINGRHISEIYFAEISEDLTKLVSEPVRITTPDDEWECTRDPVWHWNEGPAVVKHRGKYYLTYSVNCFDTPDYSVGCAVADRPEGPYKKYGYPVLRRAEGDFSGPGHNSFFLDREGRLLTAFHIHADPEKPSDNRRICIGEVAFDEDGTFRILL